MTAPAKPLLLVDDSQDDIFMLLRAIKDLGIRNPHRVVGSGDEAIDYLAGQKLYADRATYPLPSVLLLDLKMPGRDGFHVLEWIQPQQRFAQLLIIVLTGLEDVRALNRAYFLGARSFLIKPPRPEDLEELVKAFPDYWLLDHSRPS